MKKFGAIFSFLLFSLAMVAQDYKAANEGWLVNLDEAYAISQKTGKPILANFTGSDWCGWCIRLTGAVFSKPEFKSWAEKNVVLLELDFPRSKQLPEMYKTQNNNMKQALGVQGFPTVWVFKLDKVDNRYNIKTFGNTGYKSSVNEFTSQVDEIIKAGAK
ncbi:MAG: thioredoxin family protein [Saprospiraceae bacterium]|nr:thioredoxin family protein [Saprospiraceae bacterium]